MTELIFGSACKPVLDLGPEKLRGYIELHETEGIFTDMALRQMPKGAELMYRYINLFDYILRRERDFGSEVDPDLLAAQLRLRLAATATGTMKAGFDLALAGYYSAAFGLLRHLLESWQQMAYLRVVPQAALQWFPRGAIRPGQLPSQRRMANAIQRAGEEFGHLQTNARAVAEYIVQCHDGAHPSLMAMTQPNTPRDDFVQLGGNYRREWLAKWIWIASGASALLIEEILEIDDVGGDPDKEYQALLRERINWAQCEGKPVRDAAAQSDQG